PNMALPTLLWAVTASVCLGRGSVSQAEAEASRQEGDTLNLTCNYSTSESAYYLFWYKQLPTGELIYLIRQDSWSEGKKATRLSLTFKKTENLILLTIATLQLGDSAVYFCALSEAHSDGTGRRSHTQTSEF
uniref:Ig-like domain-containing protein n=1 Tax=Ornithorhynchus anatinus TaxID=9258 RepID=A0A6I8PFR1_ORNAN